MNIIFQHSTEDRAKKKETLTAKNTLQTALRALSRMYSLTDTLVLSRGVICELKISVKQGSVLNFVSHLFVTACSVAPYTECPNF